MLELTSRTVKLSCQTLKYVCKYVGVCKVFKYFVGNLVEMDKKDSDGRICVDYDNFLNSNIERR